MGASLITIVATARNVFDTGRDLYEAIDQAPNELRSVSLKAKLVSSTLEQIIALRPRIDDGDAQLLPIDLRMGLALSLQMSYESLQKLKRLCSRTRERRDLHLRLRWALLEKRGFREILEQLGNAEKDLALVLQVLHMYVPWLFPVNSLFTSSSTLAATAGYPSITYFSISELSRALVPCLHISSFDGASLFSDTADSMMNSEVAAVTSGVSADYARHISLIHRTSIGSVLAAQDALSQDMCRIALNTEQILCRQTTSGRIEEVLDDHSLTATAQYSAQEQSSLESMETKNEGTVTFLRRGRANRSLRRESPGGSYGWSKYLGISATSFWYWDQHQSTYIVAARSSLPAIFGQRALSFEMTVPQYTLSWTSLSILYGLIGVSMMIPCSSKIIEACKKRDELTVRELIESRQASPNDRIGNCSCMYGRPGVHEAETPLFVSARFDRHRPLC